MPFNQPGAGSLGTEAVVRVTAVESDLARVLDRRPPSAAHVRLLLVATLINVWAERKILADMQSRIRPSRAGPWGILQTVADGLKLFFKEAVTPRKVELGCTCWRRSWLWSPPSSSS